MDSKWYDFYVRWCALCEQWETMFCSGANALKRTDGQMLNGVRSRMVWFLNDRMSEGICLEDMLEEAEGNGFCVEKIRKSLPPVMPEQWMKDGAEKVRKDAKNALEVYRGFEDYAYILEYMPELQEGADSGVLRKIERGIFCVRRLEYAIKHDRFAEMREYAKIEKYVLEIARAKELLMMRMEHIQPFS